MTGIEVIIKKFLPEIRKNVSSRPKADGNILQTEGKQKLFQQKCCDDFNVGRSMLPVRATLQICKCHVMGFGPIMCQYFALRYNNMRCLPYNGKF